MKRKLQHSSRFDLPSDVLPLFAAVQAGDADALSRLLSEGMSPNLEDEWGLTPLHYAALGNKAYLIAPLCHAGANIEARTSAQHEHFPRFTPLHCTVEGDCIEAASELLRCGAYIDAPNAHDQTPLRLAVELTETGTLFTPAMARLFIAAGADVNTMDNRGWTIWEVASQTLELAPGHRESRAVVDLLEEAGAW